jgi:hypothetical protein
MKLECAIKKALLLGLNFEVQNSTIGGKILFVKIKGNHSGWLKFTKYLNQAGKIFDYRANYEWIAVQY